MFTLLVKDLYSSYKDLPLTLFQIQTKYRDEARPRAGLLRGREFVMKDAYSFDVDDAGLERSYQAQRDAYERIFARLGLEYVIVAATSGAMGGSRSEEFLFPTPSGEDTFVRSPGGYAANVEAARSAVPEPVDATGLPPAEVLDTPDSTTIETLVERANELHPRPDRPWTAADTLKNVVLALTHPDGTEELVVVGLPGDREVDLARLEGALEPITVAAATDEQIASRPELVKGYIGPAVVGPNAPGADGEERTSLRYLLDPRVVDGTSWVTGADAEGKHVFGLVAGRVYRATAPAVVSPKSPGPDGEERASLRYLLEPRVVDGTSWVTGADAEGKPVFGLVSGRDFTADGTIEAAEVRAGDPAPDGSGPLELARGIEIGHVFALGRKYADALGLSVLDENGKAVTVTMGSYGIGVSRALAAIAEATCDDLGLSWPMNVAPYHVHIVATGKDEQVFAEAERIGSELSARGVEVLLDDRPRMSAGVKFADAELLGVPLVLVVGRGLADGTVELRERAGGERHEVPVGEAVDTVAAAVRAALER